MKLIVNDCYVVSSYKVGRECTHDNDELVKDEFVSISFYIVQFKKHDHEWSVK